MKIEIRTRPLKDGNCSIYLDFYEKGRRRYEYLKLYLVPETDAQAKKQNRNAMDMEKPRDFDPFGQTGLPPLATI